MFSDVAIPRNLFHSWWWAELEHIFGEYAAVTVLVLLIAVLLGLGKRRCWSRFAIVKKVTPVLGGQSPGAEASLTSGSPNYPHMQICVVPYSGELNWDGKVYHAENDMCTLSSLGLHRNTWDSSLQRPGIYLGYELPGAAIKWEKRIQFRLKEVPKGILKFGIELDDYVPVNGATKIAMKLIVGAMKLIVGNDLYHSIGDDPAVTEGELERPILSMPMWAFDQVIETPEGEEPPSLIDPNFQNLGMRRKDNNKEFAQKMANMKWEVGPTYTLSFWSISSMLDLALWKISGAFPGVSMSMDQFCGRPPVHIVVYDFQPQTANGQLDHRHLDSAKRYILHIALWSSGNPPPDWRLHQLMPTGRKLQAQSVEDNAFPKMFRRYCCW